jgi:hypothetical protein
MKVTMMTKLQTLVNDHARAIAAAAQHHIQTAFSGVTSNALAVARDAAAEVDLELEDLRRRRDNAEVNSADFDRSERFLRGKRANAVTVALNQKIVPELVAGEKQLSENGGPAPVSVGDLLTAAPFTQMLNSLAPDERPAFAESVILSYAMEKRSPAALLPALRSALESKDLRGANGTPGKAWSKLHDMSEHAATLARTPDQVAATAAPDVARSLRGGLKYMEEAFADPAGIEQSPAWRTGVLAPFGGPASGLEQAQ